MDHRVVGWKVDDSISDNDFTSKGPVLDTEFVLEYRHMFKDTLIDQSGAVPR